MRWLIHQYLSDESASHHDFAIPLEALKSYTSAPGLVVDGGAYVGKFITKTLALFPDAAIHAFEPHPANYHNLQELFPGHNYPTVTLHAEALGAECGQMSLLSPNDIGQVNPNSFLEGGPVLSKVRTRQKVSVTTLECALKVAPDFVKLDLQGGEFAALRGAGDMLKKVPLMWVEVTLFNSQDAKMIEFLEAEGFVVFFGPFRYVVREPQVVQDLAVRGLRTVRMVRDSVCFGYVKPDRYAPDGLDAYGLCESVPGLDYMGADMLCVNMRIPRMQETVDRFFAGLKSRQAMDQKGARR